MIGQLGEWTISCDWPADSSVFLGYARNLLAFSMYLCIMPSIIKNIVPLGDYLPFKDKPLIIAGPCSAETEKQIMGTAMGLAGLQQVVAFRCGIWKPRTRPGEFEGVGARGLNWLKRVRTETGLKVMVEVATPAHVEQCLKAGIDMLWVGSRTIVNPFSIQEIAESLNGADIPVMVKNPVNPDLGLWLGALERLNQQGINKLAAIHRGFSVSDPRPYRNAPLWHLPLELRRQVPGLPIFADPSHICGNTALLQETSQVALELGFDGLMLETHINPSKALTDREQQITPEELKLLIATLKARKTEPGKETDSLLTALRSEIDGVDDLLLARIGDRMLLARKIGILKKSKNIPVNQREQWKEVTDKWLREGMKLGLDRNFLLRLLDILHEESKRNQEG